MRKVLVLAIAAQIQFLQPALVCAEPAMSKQEFGRLLTEYAASPEGAAELEKVIGPVVRRVLSKQAADRAARLAKSVKIDIGKSPVKGPPDAKVTIVEFSDFQCPYCRKGKAVMDTVLQAYPKDVKLVFKNYPLSFHQQALPAAKAALAAGRQGKFWEMHDVLFENQRNLTQEFFEAQAKQLGLNIEQFKKDMDSPDIAREIEADQETAKSAGIGGTPAFFINGHKLAGAMPFESFKEIIERELTPTAAATPKG